MSSDVYDVTSITFYDFSKAVSGFRKWTRSRYIQMTTTNRWASEFHTWKSGHSTESDQENVLKYTGLEKSVKWMKA